jgi:hypothetical protein
VRAKRAEPVTLPTGLARARGGAGEEVRACLQTSGPTSAEPDHLPTGSRESGLCPLPLHASVMITLDRYGDLFRVNTRGRPTHPSVQAGVQTLDFVISGQEASGLQGP